MTPKSTLNETMKEAESFIESLRKIEAIRSNAHTHNDDPLPVEKQGRPAKLNHAHEKFINEMIAHGERMTAYTRAYPGVSQSSACVNACRLLRNPVIARRIHEGLVQARVTALNVLSERYAGAIGGIEEKRKVLAEIFRGNTSFEREVYINGKLEKHQVKPGYHDRLRAIVMDNKMEEDWLRAIELPNNGPYYYGSGDE
jgi:phage terminase small subunit